MWGWATSQGARDLEALQETGRKKMDYHLDGKTNSMAEERRVG